MEVEGPGVQGQLHSKFQAAWATGHLVSKERGNWGEGLTNPDPLSCPCGRGPGCTMECDKNDTHGSELTAGTMVEPQDACAHTESGALNTFVV